MNNRKSEIDKIIKDMVKNKSLPYANAITKIKKDRKGYFQAKKTNETLLVSKEEAKFIRALRWKKMKAKVFK